MFESFIRTINLIFAERVSRPVETSALGQQVVIVTGASRGIGKAISEILRNAGARMILVSRSNRELKKIYGGDSSQLCLVEADVTKEREVKKVITDALSKFGRIDAVVNNVGAFSQKPVDGCSVNDFENIFAANVRSAFLMCKEIIPVMKLQKTGTIINIGSKISHNTNVTPGKSLYTSSKFAVEGFSIALRNELKPFGIRVTCLMPGTVANFVAKNAGDYLSPYSIGDVVSFILQHKEIDFEDFVVKSTYQRI